MLGGPEELIQRALELGFDDAGIVKLGPQHDWSRQLDEFLALGRHGSMDWLARRTNERSNPRNLWPDARSALMVAANYASSHDVFDELSHEDEGYLSVYARRKDYHDVLKKKLRQLAREYADLGHQVKLFVDTAPLMEKPLAMAAGLGWQGKHTNLVSRNFGSWLFLGALLTDAELSPSPSEQDHCGSCQACMDICPTKAIPVAYQLDAIRCLAYLSIEYKGVIAPEFRAPMGNRIYGCDDCLAICPWNKFAVISHGERAQLRGAKLRQLVRLNDQEFRSFFAGTPIKRTGRDAFVRNVLIAIANGGLQDAWPDVYALCRDDNPVVRAHAVACLKILDVPRGQDMLQSLRVGESDARVLGEFDR